MTTVPTVSDPVVTMLLSQVEANVNAIEEANKILLAADDSTSGVREIDKELKTYVPSDDNDVSEKDQEIVKAVKNLESARKALKTAQEKARNLYRVNILHEDEVDETESTDEDVLKEETKSKRKLAMEALTLAKSYAEQNGLTDVVSWANSFAVPQVGRQGASSVGAKKPRAYVTVNDTVHDSFGEAAKALSVLLSTKDNKVTVTSPDLVQAWVDSGEKDNFTYQGHEVKVAAKPTKSEQK